jgi:PPOX class probable F420-dependent enzyme
MCARLTENWTRESGGMAVPAEISGKKYVCLTSFRKNGTPVRTPVWFAEADGRLYVMTRNDSGKYKRIRNNPRISVAPCNMRGTVTGSEFAGTARILPAERWPAAKQVIHRKYWLARVPLWSRRNEYLELEISA